MVLAGTVAQLNRVRGRACRGVNEEVKDAFAAGADIVQSTSGKYPLDVCMETALGRAAAKRTPALEARILEWTRRPAPDGSTHWSSRKLAQHLGVSHMMVARVWQRAGLKPHRS